MASRSLFVSSGELIDGAAVASFVRARGAALEGLMLATHAGLAASKQQAFASICSVTSLEATHSEALCSLLFSLLQPGGSLLVQQTAQDTGSLKRQLLFQGFADIQEAAALQHGAFALTAKRPEWTTGAKSKLSLKPRAQQQKASLAAADSDVPVADAPVAAAKACKTARKACANCSCGRADAEAKGEKMTLDKLQNFSSACGSCGLGDSFRCETCPYRGQPAFEMGKKVALKSDFLTVDA